MSALPLSHRERVALALAHRETDRVPVAMVCSGINAPAYRDLEQYLRRERGIGVEEYLDPLLDIRHIGPRYVGPSLQPGEDIWGVVRAPMSYGDGAYDEIIRYPLAEALSIDDLDRRRWPSTDWFDYGSLDAEIARANEGGEECLMIGGGNPFESSWYMRGFERTLADLVGNSDLIDALLERVTGFFVEHTRRQLDAARGRVDLVFTADDIGGQQGLLLSLETWRNHIRPWHERLNAVVHQYGARVVYHSDGAVQKAVPDLLDAGVDVLQALQFDARGMDPADLKERFGDRLCFEGGVSVQSTLPFGTPEEVRHEVEERIQVLGHDGGYILGPSHAIQAGTPPENIVALFDVAARPFARAA